MHRISSAEVLEDLDIIDVSGIRLGIPSDANRELREGILAAAIAYFGGYASIDYVRRTFSAEWNLGTSDNAEEDPVRSTIKHLRPIVRRVYARLLNVPESEPLGMIGAQFHLLRLSASLDSVGLLCNLGYAFEAASIGRMVLEQTAWSLAVHQLDAERAKRLKPSKAVPLLKPLAPDSGRLYGNLSLFVHLDPGFFHQFVSLKDEKPAITLQSKQLSAGLLPLVLRVADIYCVVVEFIFHARLADIEHLTVDTAGNRLPRPDRPLVQLHDRVAPSLKEFSLRDLGTA